MIYNPDQNLVVYRQEYTKYGFSENPSFDELLGRGFFVLTETDPPEVGKYQKAIPDKPILITNDSFDHYHTSWKVIDLFTQDIFENGVLVTIDQQKARYDQAQIQILQSTYLDDVDRLMDSKTKQYGYNSIVTAVTYADEPSVPKFQEEGRAFRQWRSIMYASCYQILTQAYEGLVVINNFDDLKALLPKFPLDPEEEVVTPPTPPFDINTVPIDELPELVDPEIPGYFYQFPGFDGTNPEVLPDYAQAQLESYYLSERRRLYLEQMNNQTPEPTPEPAVTTPAVEPTLAPTDAATEPPPNTVDPQNINSTNP